MHGDRALEGDAAKLVGFAFRWTHEGIVPVLEWCAEALAGVDGPGRMPGEHMRADRPAARGLIVHLTGRNARVLRSTTSRRGCRERRGFANFIGRRVVYPASGAYSTYCGCRVVGGGFSRRWC